MSDLQREILDDFLIRLADVDCITDELAAQLGEAFSSSDGPSSADELASLITDATRGAAGC
ncbi:hypothetical protein [Candidatus Poriferisodalis sp.]|uniref:hypothetical protein n=1 Tax=Candidatus Poriferisodalis sp. TaxID=3101277 RepID=UPI003D0D7FFE